MESNLHICHILFNSHICWFYVLFLWAHFLSRGILVSEGCQVCQDPPARGFKDHWYSYFFFKLNSNQRRNNLTRLTPVQSSTKHTWISVSVSYPEDGFRAQNINLNPNQRSIVRLHLFMYSSSSLDTVCLTKWSLETPQIRRHYSSS